MVYLGRKKRSGIYAKRKRTERGAYLEGLKRLGVDVLMSDWGDEGWKAKKKEDGSLSLIR